MFEVVGFIVWGIICFGAGILFGRRNQERAKTFDEWFVINRDKIIERAKQEIEKNKSNKSGS